MGIKDVWHILQPYCERKPLFELQNKRIAIDLSGWVCQAQNVVDYQVQPKMYLRNLYFRTCFLLMQDVDLVYVLEGQAPSLKQKTLNARRDLQFKGNEPRVHPPRTDGATRHNLSRSHLQAILKQCEQMLSIMGLKCVTATGEAEALCAHLNANQFVDGVISQDSDCFAYGARIVYRNFSISTQGAHASSGGSVDVYDLRRSESDIDFGRNKIVALALLCGSDYNDGVTGVGRESALKLFASVSEADILTELRSWRSRPLPTEPCNTCTHCGHIGKRAVHTRKGCVLCGTSTSCNANADAAQTKLTLDIRRKAMQDGDFPSEALISEFLQSNQDGGDFTQVAWQRPDVAKFIEFTRRYLQWEEVYAFQKFFPLLTRWLVRHPKNGDSDTFPETIRKCRKLKGVACFEVVWRDDRLMALIPPEQLNTAGTLLHTIEPEHLVEIAYPNIVHEFRVSKAKPKKAGRKRNVKNDSLLADDVDSDDSDEMALIIEGIGARGVPAIFQRKINALLDADGAAVRHLPTESSFFALDEGTDAFEASICYCDV